MAGRGLLRVGHKGADALAPGNTLASFRAAVEAGVDVVELDVLRPEEDFAGGGDWRSAPAGPATGSGPLVVAHDWADARSRRPLTLDQALAAFAEPPLDSVGLDLDLKLAGREDEVVEALRRHRLLDRAMTSTMEVRSIHALRELEPGLPCGWTLPRVRRDWTASRRARPLVAAGSAALRARLPSLIRRHAPRLGVRSIWLYHPLASRAIARAAHSVDCRLVCWTVDELPRMRELIALDADGICSNDPRLFGQLRPA